MEDNLNFWQNGRHLNFWAKWKTTSIFGQNGGRPKFLGKMEVDLNFWAKWKTTLIFGQNGR
jgi:hypothetical protein